jgi:hypothetical protein
MTTPGGQSVSLYLLVGHVRQPASSTELGQQVTPSHLDHKSTVPFLSIRVCFTYGRFKHNVLMHVNNSLVCTVAYWAVCIKQKVHLKVHAYFISFSNDSQGSSDSSRLNSCRCTNFTSGLYFIIIAIRIGWSNDNALDSQSGSARFECWQGHWLSRLWYSVPFLSSYGQMPG